MFTQCPARARRGHPQVRRGRGLCGSSGCAGRGKRAPFHPTRFLPLLTEAFCFNTMRHLSPLLYSASYGVPLPAADTPTQIPLQMKAFGSHKEAAKEPVRMFALLIYFWPHWVFLAARGLPPAAGAGVTVELLGTGFHWGGFSRWERKL